MSKTVHRSCNLCEAHCGITVEVEGTTVLRIAGDKDDHFSKGYICPKAAALADLYEDPDRLRAPIKKVDGGWQEISWDEALDFAAKGLAEVRKRHGRNAVANYLGNPGAHNWSLISLLFLRRALGTRNNYSATSVDQLPQHLTSIEMFGNMFFFPIADVDRTDHMIVIGANPSVSNGSIWTAPGARHRLRDVIKRGGKVVVVDPRRTETANLASEHVAVKPGGDPYLLLGMLNTLFAEDLVDLGRLAGHAEGLEDVRTLAAEWTPQRVAPLAGVDAETIGRMARELAAAERAVIYGRVGVCQTETGSVTHWLINLLNTLTGNLDEPGGAMFTTSPVDIKDIGKLGRIVGAVGNGNYTQRTTGLPDMNGELPVAGLADEITTPGEGQVRALFVYAGNPVLSTPGGARLEKAMEQLEFCVSVDMYVNETNRQADVILPPVSQLERDDLDIVFPAVSIRNHVRFSPAAVPKPKDGREDWQILNELTRRLGSGDGLRGRIESAIGQVTTRLSSPARIIELSIAAGPYGVLRKGPRNALTVGKIKKAKHGIDLGPLQSRMPDILETPGKKVQLAPPVLLEAAGELEQIAAEREAALSNGFDLTLIGRRQLRSNNSWMHNSARLMKGDDRCTAMLHPDDATARGLENGSKARVSSSVGSIELPVEISDDLRPGVISIPHGFGHHRAGVGWKRAASNPGVSVNDITDPKLIDRVTGNAALNSVPVRVEAVAERKPELSATAATA